MQKEKIFELIEESQYLTELPKDMSQILDMISNPINVDIDELIDKISKSSELHSLILKKINSGYFKLNKEIKTIKEAVVFLGMQTVQNLMIFFMTLQVFPGATNKDERTFNMNKYWKHVLGTSVASCMLASRLKKGDIYKLFTYGLIHDIGIIVLDNCLPNLLDEITEKLLNGVHQLVAERIVLGGMTHAELGAWLCRKWNIREDIIKIVELHHTPFIAKTNEDVKLMYAADVISTDYYASLLGINQNHNINNKVMESLGLTKEDIQAVIKAFPEELEKVTHYFSVY